MIPQGWVDPADLSRAENVSDWPFRGTSPEAPWRAGFRGKAERC